MKQTTIKTAEYYNNPAYFPYMPEVIFNALEAAFIEGKETAEVPEEAFNSMLQEYGNRK